jgi:hypothetical protein
MLAMFASGSKRTFGVASHMSAFRGKADIGLAAIRRFIEGDSKEPRQS